MSLKKVAEEVIKAGRKVDDYSELQFWLDHLEMELNNYVEVLPQTFVTTCIMTRPVIRRVK